MEQKPLKTRQQVLEDFARRGQSIRSWAKANGVSPSVAHGVLSGNLTGRIGESHKAAVKLGLKYGEVVDTICVDNGKEYSQAEFKTTEDFRQRNQLQSHD